MKQLVLDMRSDTPPTLDNFVVGENAELLARLRFLAASDVTEAVYMWGAAGCGRSHLLRGTQAAAEAMGRHAARLGAADVNDNLPLPADGILIVDDVHKLSPAGQMVLFRAFIASGPIKPALLLAGDAPPVRLELREDLRTRIGSSLIYEVRPLSDEEKAETLMRLAVRRGMRIERDVVAYLLYHGDRDLPWLTAVLEAMDQASLEHKRPVTIPFVKEILGSGLPR